MILVKLHFLYFLDDPFDLSLFVNFRLELLALVESFTLSLIQFILFFHAEELSLVFYFFLSLFKYKV